MPQLTCKNNTRFYQLEDYKIGKLNLLSWFSHLSLKYLTRHKGNREKTAKMRLNANISIILPFVVVLLLIAPVQTNPFFYPTQQLTSIHRRDILQNCKYTVQTDTWTTCASLIDKYNITLPDFVRMNPEVERDCYHFKPGGKYCLRTSECKHGRVF